jgi:hypothetical protein
LTCGRPPVVDVRLQFTGGIATVGTIRLRGQEIFHRAYIPLIAQSLRRIGPDIKIALGAKLIPDRRVGFEAQ